MHILQESYDFLQTKLLPNISKRHKELFKFGFESLTLRPFVSLNGNARTTIEGRKTAESKIYRLTRQASMLPYFQEFVSTLALVNEYDCINVDFSTFGGFQVLTFAKQTHLGRALPVYFATITYPVISEGSQTLFIQEEIKRFVALIGKDVHLVFDRGFESPYLVPFLIKERIPFTMRFRKDKQVKYCHKEIPMRNLPWFEKDCVVEVYEKMFVRVVISEKLSQRKDSKGNEEPWYLITNDQVAAKEQVIGRYYFRFEIEEVFKDLKHINNLGAFYRIEKEQTFKILLWFCILSVWLSFLLEETKQYLAFRVTQKRRKRIAVTRFFAEAIQLELFSLARKHFF